VFEVNSGTSQAVFTVSLSETSMQTSKVDYSTSNGTATAGADYVTTSSTLTFAPGVTTQTVSVPVIGDTRYEPDETFFVDLSNPTNTTISDSRGIGTITNDDPPPDTTAPTVSTTYPDANGTMGKADLPGSMDEHFSGSCAVTSRNSLIHNGATNGTKSPRFDLKGSRRVYCQGPAAA
jgi:large repetitive protein